MGSGLTIGTFTDGGGFAWTARDHDGKVCDACDFRTFDQPEVGLDGGRIGSDFGCIAPHAAPQDHDGLSTCLHGREVRRIEGRVAFGGTGECVGNDGCRQQPKAADRGGTEHKGNARAAPPEQESRKAEEEEAGRR